jgi:hypothetical protein
MLSEMLEQHGGVPLGKQVRYELNRLLQDRQCQLDRLLGRRNRRSNPNSRRLSSSESTVRSAGPVSKRSLKDLAEAGFDFTEGFHIGTLNGAGPVPNASPRFRTPPWLLDKQRVKDLHKHFEKTRKRTARSDIKLLIGYYLSRRSDAYLYLYRDGVQLKLDKKGGFTNIQRYRERLIEIGYKFFGMQKPDWKGIREQQKGLPTRDYGTGADPKEFMDAKHDVRERSQGSVEAEAQRSLAQLEQKFSQNDRDEIIEEDRQGLSPQLQAADRQLQRQIDLVHHGRITTLYKELLGGTRGTRNGQNLKSPVTMRSKDDLSGNVAICEGAGVRESSGTSPLADARQAA